MQRLFTELYQNTVRLPFIFRNLIIKKMKKQVSKLSFVFPVMLASLLLFSFSLYGQDTTAVSTSLPDSIKTIVTVSCMPCHSDAGGAFSKPKLNFEKWTEYSIEKQKERATMIYSEIEKGAMPTKSARERSPEKIPTKEQLAIIKNWSESLNK
jgi:hypothetical protein